MDGESLLTELGLCPPVSQWMIGHHAIILLIHVTNNVAIEEISSKKKTQPFTEIDSGGLGSIFFIATALRILSGAEFMLYRHYPIRIEFCACTVFSVRRGLVRGICADQIRPVWLQTLRVRQLS